MVIKVQKSLLSFSLETSMHLVEKAQSDVLSLPQNQDSSPGPHPAQFLNVSNDQGAKISPT